MISLGRLRSKFRNFKLNRVISSSESLLPTASGCERSLDTFFVGRMKEDVTNFVGLEDLREQAQGFVTSAIPQFDQFLSVVFQIIERCEKLPRAHPFHLRSDLMFIGKRSPVHKHIKEIMEMCYRKARVAKLGTGGNNHSGYYYIGPKGIGKSTLFKTCCLISGILLDNLVPVYVDYASHNFQHISVIDAVKCALKQRENISEEELENLNISGAIRLANSKEIALALFLDESHPLYADELSWSSLHQIATSFGNCMFMTGSESLLSRFVASSTNDRHLINQLGYDVRQSLNDTKIQRRFIHGLNSFEQYCIYFDHPARVDLKIKHFPHHEKKTEDIPGAKEIISHLHGFYNGKLRGLQCKPSDSHTPPPFGTPPLHQKVLLCFKSKIDETGFNPFEPVVLSEFEITNCLKLETQTSDERETVKRVIYDMLDSKQLLQVEDGFTLYSPYIYLCLEKLQPPVFISHACSDMVNLYPLFEQINSQTATKFIYCEESVPQAKMASGTIIAWEKSHFFCPETPHKYFICALTPEYCRKVIQDQSSGVFREFTHLLTFPIDKKFEDRVIFVWYDENGSNMFQDENFKKIHHQIEESYGDKLILKLVTDATPISTFLTTSRRTKNSNNDSSRE